jgi:hypothetical protein
VLVDVPITCEVTYEPDEELVDVPQACQITNEQDSVLVYVFVTNEVTYEPDDVLKNGLLEGAGRLVDHGGEDTALPRLQRSRHQPCSLQFFRLNFPRVVRRFLFTKCRQPN